MPEVSIVLPTYNERDNIPIIIDRISKKLKTYEYEIVVVDDNSPDKTYKIAQELAKKNSNIKVIRRIKEKGLSSAIASGFANATGKYRIVMDADLQHDCSVLPQFIENFRHGKNLVIGTRKADGGKIENWSPIRKFISWGATILAKITLLTRISDPMSGFFGINANYFEKIHSKLNPRGFKLLLELLMLTKNNEIAEVGFVFSPRIHGESKLSSDVMLQYLLGLYDLRLGKYIPLKFIQYSLVGVSGVIINLGFQYFGENYYLSSFTDYTIGSIQIAKSQLAVMIAIEISIISNFFLNNYWTFKAQKLIGTKKIIKGLFNYNAVCLAGAFINFAIFSFLLEKFFINKYLANLIGIFAATAWNYFINTQMTWKVRK